MASASPPPVHFEKFQHLNASKFLRSAISSGKLGEGPAEPEPSISHNAISVLGIFPRLLMAVQLLWSTTVVIIAYFVAKNTLPKSPATTLSNDFWISRIIVTPAVTYTLGWAVFVLLGLFVSEASARFHTARSSIFTVGSQLSFLLRKLHQCYPPGTWHPGDHERIAAHLIAYPIALKMSLRNDRSPEQLRPILHENDIHDLVNADTMHVHCLRVVRAYISAAEDDSAEFYLCDTGSTPAGALIRKIITKFTDDIDSTASTVTRIAQFRPSVAYVNHLHILLSIWLMFIPITLIVSSGW